MLWLEPVPGPAALLPTQLPPTSQTQADSPSAEAPALPVGEGGAASGSWLLPAQPLGVGHWQGKPAKGKFVSFTLCHVFKLIKWILKEKQLYLGTRKKSQNIIQLLPANIAPTRSLFSPKDAVPPSEGVTRYGQAHSPTRPTDAAKPGWYSTAQLLEKSQSSSFGSGASVRQNSKAFRPVIHQTPAPGSISYKLGYCFLNLSAEMQQIWGHTADIWYSSGKPLRTATLHQQRAYVPGCSTSNSSFLLSSFPVPWEAAGRDSRGQVTAPTQENWVLGFQTCRKWASTNKMSLKLKKDNLKDKHKDFYANLQVEFSFLY